MRSTAALRCELNERALNAPTIHVPSKRPLFLGQKGGPYNPDTLQDQIVTMDRTWAGTELQDAGSSGPRRLRGDSTSAQEA